MTDVTSGAEVWRAAVSGTGAVDDGLVAELVAWAQAGGVKLSGEGALLEQLTKRVPESALEGELTGRPGTSRVGGPRRSGELPQRVPLRHGDHGVGAGEDRGAAGYGRTARVAAGQ